MATKNIYRPAYADSTKTFPFFDIIHLIKNIRSNLLNQKKFVYPSFQLDLFRDAIDLREGFISWHILHELYEGDGKLQGHLRKALHVTYQLIHPGNSKQ